MSDRNPVYVVDKIGEVVSSTNDALKEDPTSYLSTSARILNYIYGDNDEINKQMQLLSQGKDSKQKRFPLVALILPLKIIDGELWEVPLLKIVIATETDENILFPKRYEQSFKPILYPVYYELITQLSYRTVESDPQAFRASVTEVPKYIPVVQQNKTDGILNTIVDALVIEIQNIKFFSPFNC
jgi:hypothetical protein